MRVLGTSGRAGAGPSARAGGGDFAVQSMLLVAAIAGMTAQDRQGRQVVRHRRRGC